MAVVDGDTFDVDPPVALPDGTGQDRVRALGIDTPELSEGDCYAEEARTRLVELIEGEEVTLHFTDEPLDIRGRLLAWVMLDGVLVNLLLVEEGYAVPIEEYFQDPACVEQIDEAAAAAREEGLGGWGVCSGPPWEP